MKTILIILLFIERAFGSSIICTNNSPKQYFYFPQLPRCNFNYKDNIEVKSYEVFKPNTIEYISNAHLCKKVISEVSLHTDLSGYEHLVEKEINNKEISIKECEEMIKNKFCEFETLKKGENSFHTNNKIASDYPNRFTSLFRAKHYLKENCILIETKVFSHYNQKRPTNILVDMNNCNYLKGRCQIKPNEIMIWEVNDKQNCKFISIGVFKGYLNGNFWINNDYQIALNLVDNFTSDYGNNLQLISEGYAVKSIKEKRSDRGVKTFQQAGELQYLENNVENQLRHLTQTFCQLFNDHNEILEILLKENPRKYIQKVLNYTAVDVKLINTSIIEVKFCKEIDNDLIEFTELNDIKGFIPVRIKKYTDKIWYMKGVVITNDISLHTESISNLKNIEIKRDYYDLRFLKNKLIFKEHIFDDVKTNIEEELLNELRQVSNAEVELKENEQNSMVPHEIINDLDNLFESYWLKYWRIYVTIASTLVYIFIVRSLIYVISP